MLHISISSPEKTLFSGQGEGGLACWDTPRKKVPMPSAFSKGFWVGTGTNYTSSGALDRSSPVSLNFRHWLTENVIGHSTYIHIQCCNFDEVIESCSIIKVHDLAWYSDY